MRGHLVRQAVRAATGERVLPVGGGTSVTALQRAVGNAAVARMLGVRVQRRAVDDVLRSAGRPVDDEVRADMESRLGADFSDVRVHTDAKAHAAAESVRAQAFTTGRHLVFGRGRFDARSTAGRRTLAHELVHVIQQRSGPVAGTDRGDGVRVSHPADEFERHAEATAAEAMSAHADHVGHDHRHVRAAPSADTPVQRVDDEDEDDLPVMATDEFRFTRMHSPRYRRDVLNGWQMIRHEPDPIPRLKASEDGSVAIRADEPQPKEFFATKDVLRQANETLELAGGRVVLEEGQWDVPSANGGDGKLTVVRPRLRTRPREADRYADLVADQCVEVAEQVLRPLTHLVFRDAQGVAATSERDPEMGQDSAARLAGALTGPQPPRTTREAARAAG
ncbi:MAG: DUF4157 domain-containing protein, partial [Saccharothrix sp.]|nr:DUF4157 domain-containing protein [Saccharothrix sp.]